MSFDTKKETCKNTNLRIIRILDLKKVFFWPPQKGPLIFMENKKDRANPSLIFMDNKKVS